MRNLLQHTLIIAQNNIIVKLYDKQLQIEAALVLKNHYTYLSSNLQVPQVSIVGTLFLKSTSDVKQCTLVTHNDRHTAQFDKFG